MVDGEIPLPDWSVFEEPDLGTSTTTCVPRSEPAQSSAKAAPRRRRRRRGADRRAPLRRPGDDHLLRVHQRGLREWMAMGVPMFAELTAMCATSTTSTFPPATGPSSPGRRTRPGDRGRGRSHVSSPTASGRRSRVGPGPARDGEATGIGGRPGRRRRPAGGRMWGQSAGRSAGRRGAVHVRSSGTTDRAAGDGPTLSPVGRAGHRRRRRCGDGPAGDGHRADELRIAELHGRGLPPRCPCSTRRSGSRSTWRCSTAPNRSPATRGTARPPVCSTPGRNCDARTR